MSYTVIYHLLYKLRVEFRRDGLESFKIDDGSHLSRVYIHPVSNDLTTDQTDTELQRGRRQVFWVKIGLFKVICRGGEGESDAWWSFPMRVRFGAPVEQAMREADEGSGWDGEGSDRLERE